jgi:hypothetical protein
MRVNVDRGIDTLVLPTDRLPQLSKPKVFENQNENRIAWHVNY